MDLPNLSVFSTLFSSLQEAQFSERIELLKSLTDGQVKELGPIRLWNYFRDMSFLEGELRISEFLKADHLEQPEAILLATETYLSAGMQRAAEEALEVAINYSANSNQLRKLVDYTTLVKRNDLCESVAAMISTDTSMQPLTKVKLGIHFSNLCSVSSARYLSLRCLRMLAEQYSDEKECLSLIADALVQIREYSMALGIRKRLASEEPGNTIRELDVLLVRSRFDRDGVPSELAKIIARPNETKEFWERVSWIYQFLGSDYLDRAIESCRRLLRLGGDEIGTRRQIVAMYYTAGNFRKVRSEILQILLLPNVGAHVLRHLATIARQIGELDMARRCAYLQFETTRFTGEGIKRLNRPPAEWVELAIEAEKLGNYDLEMKVIHLGLSCYPNERELLARNDYLMKRQDFLKI